MSFDLSSILFIVVAILALQPLLMGRWYAIRRAQAIRAIEKEHGSRVITLIHRQEKRSLFGFAISRYIDLEDAQTVIAAIKETPDDTPIDLIVLVLQPSFEIRNRSFSARQPVVFDYRHRMARAETRPRGMARSGQFR